MSRTLVSLARRRGRLPALVAALCIAAVLMLVRLVNELVAWMAASAVAASQPVSLGAGDGLYELQPTAGFDASRLLDYLPQALPFALGVFLGLWLIAPLADELTLPFVFTRGALATAAGAVLVVVAQVVIALVVAVEEGVLNGQGFVRDVSLGALAGLSSFVNYLLIVLFASVLLWLWLRAHPRDYAVSGLIDEL